MYWDLMVPWNSPFEKFCLIPWLYCWPNLRYQHLIFLFLGCEISSSLEVEDCWNALAATDKLKNAQWRGLVCCFDFRKKEFKKTCPNYQNRLTPDQQTLYIRETSHFIVNMIKKSSLMIVIVVDRQGSFWNVLLIITQGNGSSDKLVICNLPVQIMIKATAAKRKANKVHLLLQQKHK